jgi:hypothetical protein
MKTFLTLLLCVAFASCSKEQIQTNAVISAMTNGQWKVVNFMNGNTNMTSDFSVYKFQFKTNLSVDAINNNTVEKTGTWNADANARTITSNFTNASNPLMLLNGTWKITNNSWNFVEASQTVNNELRTLRLEKL